MNFLKSEITSVTTQTVKAVSKVLRPSGHKPRLVSAPGLDWPASLATTTESVQTGSSRHLKMAVPWRTFESHDCAQCF